MPQISDTKHQAPGASMVIHGSYQKIHGLSGSSPFRVALDVALFLRLFHFAGSVHESRDAVAATLRESLKGFRWKRKLLGQLARDLRADGAGGMLLLIRGSLDRNDDVGLEDVERDVEEAGEVLACGAAHGEVVSICYVCLVLF